MSTAGIAIGTAVTNPAGVRQLSIPALLLLHLVPGVLMTAGFVLLAPLAETLGFPPITALLAAIAVVLVPTELAILALAARAEGVSIGALIPYRSPIAARTWAWLLPTLIVAGLPWLRTSSGDRAGSDQPVLWLAPRVVRQPDRRRPDRLIWRDPLARHPGRVLPHQRPPRSDRRGALLPGLPPAADGPLRSLGASDQCQPLLPVPLLVALADRRPDPRLRADGLRGLVEAQRLAGHGRPLHPEFAWRSTRRRDDPEPDLTIRA